MQVMTKGYIVLTWLDMAYYLVIDMNKPDMKPISNLIEQ